MIATKKLARRIHALAGENSGCLTIKTCFLVAVEDDAVLGIEAISYAWAIVLSEIESAGASTTWPTDDMGEFVAYLSGYPRAAAALQCWSLGKSDLKRADFTRGRRQ